MLFQVNSIEKWTEMKNTGLKKPEKDQIYVLVGAKIIGKSFSIRILCFKVSELIHGLTHSRKLKKQCMYM